jgi:hypothetical protein
MKLDLPKYQSILASNGLSPSQIAELSQTWPSLQKRTLTRKEEKQAEKEEKKSEKHSPGFGGYGIVKESEMAKAKGTGNRVEVGTGILQEENSNQSTGSSIEATSTSSTEKENMATLNFAPLCDMADLPVLRHKGGMSVRIQNTGQIGFSTQATEALNKYNFIVVLTATDGDGKRVMAFHPCDVVPPKFKEKSWVKIGKSEKHPGNIYVTGSRILTRANYDYANSGTQTFDATWDEKNRYLSFHLPEGALTPKPQKPRKPKAEKANGTANGSPVPADVPAPLDEAEVVAA